MGEFISRGIAIAFGVGATVALVARGHPLTRRHPNLIGLAAGATADAMTRDYRRPRIYDRLLRLDTHLGSKARGLVVSMRTGDPEPTNLISVSQNPVTLAPSDNDAPPIQSDWWSSPSDSQPESQSQSSAPANIYGVDRPIQLPKGGPIGGTRTWDDIRNGSSGKQN